MMKLEVSMIRLDSGLGMKHITPRILVIDEELESAHRYQDARANVQLQPDCLTAPLRSSLILT